MHQFNTDVFTQQTIANLGQVASGQSSPINLIASMPGMGIVSSLQQGCQQLAKQGVSSSIITLEDLGAERFLAKGGELQPLDSPVAESSLLILDIGHSALAATDLDMLADYAQANAKRASVWIVGGAVDALGDRLEDQSKRFGVVQRSRITVPETDGDNATTAGRKPPTA